MTAYGDVEKAVAAMQTGACDYLLKPFDPDSLLAHIKRYVLSELEQEDKIVAKIRVREHYSLSPSGLRNLRQQSC